MTSTKISKANVWTKMLGLLLFFNNHNSNFSQAFTFNPANTRKTSIVYREHQNTSFHRHEAASTETDGGGARTSFKAPEKEITMRRNLAIISHPDSGKTTMTEKLLLYGGALQQAGAVRQKAEQRATTSDFMEMEKERGISISATVMNLIIWIIE